MPTFLCWPEVWRPDVGTNLELVLGRHVNEGQEKVEEEDAQEEDHAEHPHFDLHRLTRQRSPYGHHTEG